MRVSFVCEPAHKFTAFCLQKGCFEPATARELRAVLPSSCAICKVGNWFPYSRALHQVELHGDKIDICFWFINICVKNCFNHISKIFNMLRKQYSREAVTCERVRLERAHSHSTPRSLYIIKCMGEAKFNGRKILPSCKYCAKHELKI